MAASYKTISELAERATRRATQDTRSWTNYLSTAARLYKYPFQEQLLIREQRPNATACASFEVWNRQLHRVVRRGTTGIALIDEASPRPKLKYVFDVADTIPHQENTLPPYVWSIRPEYETEVAESLTSHFGDVPPDCDDFPYLLHDIADIAAADHLPDYTRDFLAACAGSRMEALDDQSAATVFQRLVETSVAWCVMARCGLQPEAYIDAADFSAVADFNTPTGGCLPTSVLGGLTRKLSTTASNTACSTRTRNTTMQFL